MPLVFIISGIIVSLICGLIILEHNFILGVIGILIGVICFLVGFSFLIIPNCTETRRVYG